MDMLPDPRVFGKKLFMLEPALGGYKDSPQMFDAAHFVLSEVFVSLCAVGDVLPH